MPEIGNRFVCQFCERALSRMGIENLDQDRWIPLADLPAFPGQERLAADPSMAGLDAVGGEMIH